MSESNHTGTLVPFNYQGATLRTVLINNEPWFVAPDACQMLSLRDTSSALKMVDTDDKQSLRRSDTPQFFSGIAPQVQFLTVVNESGMWTLIFQSNKDQARKVRRWITREVLPEIRRTGSYGQRPALTDDEIVAQALAITTHRVKELESVVQELAPDAHAWRKLADSDGNFGVADAAKMLSQDPHITIGRDRLFSFMESAGWIKRRNHRRGGWFAYQHQVDCGRLHERPATPFLNRKTGEYELPAPTIRVTAKGVAELHRLLAPSKAVAS